MMNEHTETKAGSNAPSSASKRTVVPCNFRSAGRLSNDSTRHLRTMHETFARDTAHSLDLFLGSPLEMKLTGIEQLGSREMAASLSPSSYLVPLSIQPMTGRAIAKFDHALLSPLLDILLGGTGEPLEEVRDLTDIDEELIRSVTELMASQLERAWKACSVNVAPQPSVKPALVGQLFAADERAVVLQFQVTLASTTAPVRIILPMAFSNALVRSSQIEATKRIVSETGSHQRLRDRLLECTMRASTDLPHLRVSVGELLDLAPGTILNLRAPVNTPVQLRVSDRPVFEVTPVRRGARKSAQLGRAYI